MSFDNYLRAPRHPPYHPGYPPRSPAEVKLPLGARSHLRLPPLYRLSCRFSSSQAARCTSFMPL